MYFNVIYDFHIYLHHTNFVDITPYGLDRPLCSSISNKLCMNRTTLNCNRYKLQIKTLENFFKRQSVIKPFKNDCMVKNKEDFKYLRKLMNKDINKFINRWMIKSEERDEFL